MVGLAGNEIAAEDQLVAGPPRVKVDGPTQVFAKGFGEVKGHVLGVDALGRFLLRHAVPVLRARDFEVARVGHHADEYAVFRVHSIGLARFQDALVDFGHHLLVLDPPTWVALGVEFFDGFALLLDPGVVLKVVNALTSVVGQLLHVVDGQSLQMLGVDGGGIIFREEIQQQWYDDNYWQSIPACVDQIDELIEEFNTRTGLLNV